MVKKIIKNIFVASLVLAPLLSFAVPFSGGFDTDIITGGGGGVTFKGVLEKIMGLFTPLPAMILTLAVIYFFWNIGQYLKSADIKKAEEARNMIIYGIIAIAVMVGVWGLVALITNTFGLGTAAPVFPQL